MPDKTSRLFWSSRAPRNGTACPRIVQSIDIYPTLVELCGLPPAKDLDGKSLAPLVRNPHAPWSEPAYTVWSEDGQSLTGVSVRTDRWHFAEFFGPGAGKMLIDPQADPHELTNLADDPRRAWIVAELSRLAHAYRAGQQNGSH